MFCLFKVAYYNRTVNIEIGIIQSIRLFKIFKLTIQELLETQCK